jgi:hypothetical protein
VRRQSKDSILFLRVATRNRDGTNEKWADTATGFIVTGSGHVVSVAHIVTPETASNQVAYYASFGPRDSQRFQLNLIRSDPDADVSLFQLPPSRDWQPLRLASSAQLPDDARLFVLGFPRELDLASAEGILSSRYSPKGRFQTTLPLNHGNSGAPVFDISGRVVGIAAGGLDQAQLITFVVPSDFLRPLMLISGLEITQPSAVTGGGPGPSSSTSEGWVAVGIVSSNDPNDVYFDYSDGSKISSSPAPNALLKARKDVNIRAAPADWKNTKGTLGFGRCFTVQETKPLNAGGKTQIWVSGKRSNCGA